MAKATYRHAGDSIPHTPASAVTGGDIIVLGNSVIGYAKADIAANELGALALEGVYDVQKVGGRAFYAFETPVYWDSDGNPYQGTAGTGAATDDGAAGVFMGWPVADAAAFDTTVRVRAVVGVVEETLPEESGSSQSA